MASALLFPSPLPLYSMINTGRALLLHLSVLFLSGFEKWWRSHRWPVLPSTALPIHSYSLFFTTLAGTAEYLPPVFLTLLPESLLSLSWGCLLYIFLFPTQCNIFG